MNIVNLCPLPEPKPVGSLYARVRALRLTRLLGAVASRIAGPVLTIHARDFRALRQCWPDATTFTCKHLTLVPPRHVMPHYQPETPKP